MMGGKIPRKKARDTMKHLRQYIRELLLLEQGTLGRFVWPSALGPTAPDEPDTDIEELLYRELADHFGGYGALSDEAITAIQQILDSGEYTDVFSRCTEGRMYRGMRVKLPWLEEHAPEALEGLPVAMKDPIDWGDPIPITMTYVSEGMYGKVSSWTGDREQARVFSTYYSSDTVPVILHSNCNSGYFMSTMGMKRYKGGRYKDEFDINKLNPNAHEREVLLFGDCTVTAIEINARQKDVERLRK